MKKRMSLLVMSLMLFALAANAAEITGIDSLKGMELAAQRGTTGYMIAEDILGNDAKKLLTGYERYADAIAALRAGKVAAVIMDEAPARRFVEASGELTILDEPLSIESYAIGFKKGNTALRDAVDAVLTEMRSSGVIDEIIDRYLNGDLPDPSTIDFNKGAKGGDFIVGTEAGFAPYELKVGNGYVGIDIEIMAEVARKLGRTLVIENMNFDALPMAVASGKVDAIAAGITVTDERKKNMDFSINYVEGIKEVAVVRTADIKK